MFTNTPKNIKQQCLRPVFMIMYLNINVHQRSNGGLDVGLSRYTITIISRTTHVHVRLFRYLTTIREYKVQSKSDIYVVTMLA